MRDEKEILMEILDFAKRDDQIRCAVLNGSRANPNAPRDFMMDYDVAFYMTDLANSPYKIDHGWVHEFGELVIMQQNDLEEGDGSYICMMQFTDGVRLDLIFRDVKAIHKVHEDSLSRVLLDKDGLLPNLPLPNETAYFVQKPSEAEWDANLNELWWLQIYVAKALWREELPRAKDIYDCYFMPALRKLIAWHVGFKYDWYVNIGSSGKWLKNYLEEDLYHEYLSLFCGANPEEQWQKLFQAGSLIGKIGVPLAEQLGFHYPGQDAKNVTAYIERIRQLPADARSL